jgi:hypothetical protein
VDLQTIKARYTAAFDAYQARKCNAERTSSGKNPSAADIRHEKNARRTLEAAGRALRAALSKGNWIVASLERAERHVSDGERLVKRQRAITEQLRHHGHDVGLATQLLAALEQSLQLHIGDRDRLRLAYAVHSR